MATATIVGGAYVGLSLNAVEARAAQAALFAAAGANTDSEVHTNLNQLPGSGVFNVYQLTPTAGQTYQPTAAAGTIVLEGSNSASIRDASTASHQLIIGNAGNDTISATGGSETVIVGDGSNSIVTGGNDTIRLGKGDDTISARGAATVYGSSGQLHLDAQGGGSIHSGTGSETIKGGTGTLTFLGSKVSTSSADVQGGSGKNVFVGSGGHDTLAAGSSLKALSNVFEFASSISGGTHVIQNYSTATGEIELKGYSQTDISSFKDINGSTYIKLDDGTSITVRGAALSETDIKFTH